MSLAVARGRATETVLASACLLGVHCRYDATSREDAGLVARLAGCHVVPVCPEQLGGLPTPRVACRLADCRDPGRAVADGAEVLEGRARVVEEGGVDERGADRTAEFIRGAEETLRLARLTGARKAFLKAKSPSCDARAGVTAARLRRAGIEIESVD